MQESKQLTLLVEELLSAHEDTIRLAGELALTDWHWEEHVAYLEDLARFGRAALTAATDCAPAARRPRLSFHIERRGQGRCARNGHDEGPA
jgi:hypothetical protein